MPAGVPKIRDEALANLQIDSAFFDDMLRQELKLHHETSHKDYDLYLMDKGVLPLLLQGLDALGRHVDKVEFGKTPRLGGSSKVPFNPLTWLAQYLLRNHPGHVRDERNQIYSGLAELADIERGRRNLLRRRHELEDDWREVFETSSIGAAGITDLPLFIYRLDSKWNLGGQFTSKFPTDWHEPLNKTPDASHQITFDDWWKWFEEYVSQHDLLRVKDLEAAARRREEAEMRAQAAEEAALRQERALQDVIATRRAQEARFDALSADLYTNNDAGKILTKGAFINTFAETEASDAKSVVPKGEHVSLILGLLSLWGTFDGAVQAEWSPAASAAWRTFATERGFDANRLDTAGLKALLDRDTFQDQMMRANPVPELEDDTFLKNIAEVIAIVEKDQGVCLEVIDEESGEAYQPSVTQFQAAEVRRRLERGGEALRVLVDPPSNSVVELMPPKFGGPRA